MLTRKQLGLPMVLLLPILFVLSACTEEPDANEHSEPGMAIESAQESEVVAWNKVCPICGQEVDAGLGTVSYEGKVYGFGCGACPEMFEADPEKYIKNLNEDGSEFIGG